MILQSLSFEELGAQLAPLTPSRTALLKLFAAVHAHGARDMTALQRTPQLPKRVAEHLSRVARFPRLEVVERRRAADGFVKYLFASPLGGRFEAVRIPLFDTKHVVCVSSQVGCALACDFCMTGKLGFQRNLATWEMLEQVQRVKDEADRPVRGVVFMGMGEPLLNYGEVIRAAQVLAHP
ncbi:MAG TPA: radical SAM protein, partial [Thermoanaerobaculia bacterium]|nr:radical SAM protein [Thermoanaerobaculia bacterium]